MCEPATLLLVSAGLSAVSTGVGAVMASQQAKAQAQIADRNAALERNAVQDELQNTRQQALARYREVAKIKGQQRLAAAANGVGLDFGTAADIVADTDMLGREDVQRIYTAGDRAVKSRDINASNYVAQANMARSQATGALIGGALDMGSTILSGASQYGQMKDAYQWKNVYRLTPNARDTINANPVIF